jgi:M6 family metalloprotease-like protein
MTVARAQPFGAIGMNPETSQPLDTRYACGRQFWIGTLLAAISLAAVLATNASHAAEPDATPFGWRMKEAKGTRPLLVIWVRQPDDMPASEIASLKQYFEELLFGRPAHGPYPDALRALEPTLVGYYQDASAGKFTWRRAGFVGPVSAPVQGKSAAEIARLALTAAASEGHVDFTAFDTNHDGVISPNELTLLVVSNVPSDIGQAGHFGRFRIPGQNVIFAGGDGVVGEGGTFGNIAHELFHTLGGIDLYGPKEGCYYINPGLTLMAYSGGRGIRDAEWMINLDPWHKMLVGWIEPRVIPIGLPGKAQLAAQHLPLSSEPVRKRPLLIYDPARGKSEFFLLEYRTPYRLGYDERAATSGLVIWHVAYDSLGNPATRLSERRDCKGALLPVKSVFVRGAPDWQQGISKAYTSADGDISLKWMDGHDSGVRVRVEPHKPSDAVIDISWTAATDRGSSAIREPTGGAP